MAMPCIIFIHCLYKSKLNSILRTLLVERLNDDLKVAGSNPLCAVFFLQRNSLVGIRLYSSKPTVRMTEA